MKLITVTEIDGSVISINPMHLIAVRDYQGKKGAKSVIALHDGTGLEVNQTRELVEGLFQAATRDI